MIVRFHSPKSRQSWHSSFNLFTSINLINCFSLLLICTASVIAAPLETVSTAKHPATNTYHNVTVADPYQWLEDATNPAVRDWMRQQNERTRAYFKNLPYHDGIAQQLLQLRSDESARILALVERKGRIFALRFKPPAQQPVLVRYSSLERPALWKPVFDPNIYNTNGTTAIDWFVPSPDGKLIAISLSEGGSEQGTLHFFEADTGKELSDTIPRVQYPTGGGSAAWVDDGSAILYTRYPHQGERPEQDVNFFQQVWIHKLGTPASEDKYEMGKDSPRIAEIELERSENSPWICASVANGDGGDFAHYVRDGSGKWTQVTRFEDGVKHAKLGRDNGLYLLSRKDAPHGKIVHVPLEAPELSSAKLVTPESKGVIAEYAPADNGLYVSRLLGGPSELLYFPKGKTTGREIPVLPISSVAGLQSWHGDDLVFGNVSYLKPFAWFTLSTGSREAVSAREDARPTQGSVRPTLTALAMTSPVDFDDMEVVREFATSKDGTKVPLNIMRKKGVKLNEQNPTVLYGYGGYGISLSPAFDVTRRIWFDAGGVYVIANLRGGGEYGEEWHKSGNLTKKQNVFDDFIAAAEYLISKHYTNPQKLAIEGASNGGLLMGAALTQRPDLFRAVVSRVGIYDMLRIELDPNGQFNITEFGTVKDAAQFKALYAYSPYHHVKDGTKYPAVILTTGENDGRVNPAQSRKMAARLQAATGSDHPILIRSSAAAGHGMGSSLKERIAEQSDLLSFLFDQLGIDAKSWMFD